MSTPGAKFEFDEEVGGGLRRLREGGDGEGHQAEDSHFATALAVQ